MPIRIGGNSYLVPAPLVSFSKEYLLGLDGEALGAEFKVTLNGTLLPNKGNPVSTSGAVTSSFSNDAWVTTQDPCDDPSHGN